MSCDLGLGCLDRGWVFPMWSYFHVFSLLWKGRQGPSVEEMIRRVILFLVFGTQRLWRNICWLMTGAQLCGCGMKVPMQQFILDGEVVRPCGLDSLAATAFDQDWETTIQLWCLPKGEVSRGFKEKSHFLFSFSHFIPESFFLIYHIINFTFSNSDGSNIRFRLKKIIFVYWEPLKRETIKDYCCSVKFQQQMLEESVKTIAFLSLDNLFLPLFACICFKTFQGSCFYLRHVICRIPKYKPVLWNFW